MAVEYIKRLAGPYVGDGTGQKTFSFGFLIFDESDVYVAVAASSDSEPSDLQQGTDYTVSMNADQSATPGGTITLTSESGLAKDAVLVIGSAVDYTQTLDLTNYTRFAPERITTELDRIVVMIQQIVELLGRVVQVPPTSSISPSDLFFQLLNAAESAAQSAEDAAASLAACEQIRQYIAQYSWDIPHLVNTLKDVENYPFDGYFWVLGFGDVGVEGQDISNRVVKADDSTTALTLGERFADLVSVKNFGAKGDGVTDDTAAIIAAQKTGRAVYFPRGTYVCTDEILIDKEGVSFIGEGKGYYRWHAVNPLFDVPCTRILFKGTGKKSVKTRVRYRASKQDSNDSPISTAINIQADGFTLRDMTVELYCDYSDKAASNMGDDWDVGIFHGSRVDLRITDVNVVGYWREASVWLDSTRGVNLPELNGYSKTEGAGSDGISLVRVMTCGGKWGLRRLGPQPKDGLLHFGYQYKRGAKFVFTKNPEAGDSITIRGETFSFAQTGTSSSVVAIGETVFDTAQNFVSSWKSVTNRLVPYDELTLVATEQGVDIYSTSSSPTELSATSNAIAVQTFDGASTTQTVAVADPAPYFDSVSGQSYDDGRDALGGSDFVANNCVFYSIEHHSGQAITSKTDSATAQNDTCGGAAWVDGLGGNALLHRQFFIHTRFHSREPYNVKLGFVGRARFVGCTHDGEPVETYGKMVGDRDKTAIVQVFGYDDPGDNFPRGVNKNQIYSHFYLEGDNLYVRDRASVGADITVGTDKTGSATAYVNIVSGEKGNAEVRFSSKTSDTISRIRSSVNGGLTISIRSGGSGDLANALFMSGSSFVPYQAPRPPSDASLSLGTASVRWSEVYASTGAISTSDERYKQDIIDPDEALMRAWGKVKYRLFRFKDAVAKKGEAARIHAGLIAQQVIEAFASEGLDALRYGVVCYDKWGDEYEDVEVVDKPEVLDEKGNVISPAVTHIERRKVIDAGDRYSIRYDEADVLEHMYERWERNQIKQRLTVAGF